MQESGFLDCWKIQSMVLVYLRILGRGLWLKTTTLLFFFWLLIKAVDHIKKCGPFSEIQYGFRSCHSSADLLGIRGTMTFNTVFNICNFLTWFGTFVLVRNSILVEFQAGIFARSHNLLVLNSFGWFWMSHFCISAQSMLVFLKALSYSVFFFLTHSFFLSPPFKQGSIW